MLTNSEKISESPTYRLDLTSSPHVHSRWNTKQAMWLVVIALLPALISGIIYFGLYQLVIIGVSIVFSLGTEYAIKMIRKRKATLWDGSAVITGLLLGLIIPPNFSSIVSIVLCTTFSSSSIPSFKSFTSYLKKHKVHHQSNYLLQFRAQREFYQKYAKALALFQENLSIFSYKIPLAHIQHF